MTNEEKAAKAKEHIEAVEALFLDADPDGTRNHDLRSILMALDVTKKRVMEFFRGSVS